MRDDITHQQPKTLSVPEAGRKYFGMGRNAAYAAAKRGDIPTIRLGRLLRAPVVALERRLDEATAVKHLDPMSHDGRERKHLRESRHDRCRYRSCAQRREA